MDAYVFRGALYCEACGRGIVEELAACGREDTGDSDDFPQGPYPDGGGEAGADQPPETADLAAFGVIGLVKILEGARRAAAIELWQPILPLGSGEGAKASMLRVAAAIDHEP